MNSKMQGLNSLKKRLLVSRAPHGSRELSVTVALFTLSLVVTESVSASTYRSPVEKGVVAALTPERDLVLEAQPHNGEGMLGFALRFCGERAAVERISKANSDLTRLLISSPFSFPLTWMKNKKFLR